MTLRDNIFDLQKVMLNFPQVILPLNHYKCGNIYVRELFIPQGTTVVGNIHKYAHVVMVTKGQLSFSVGDEIKTVNAPFITRSDPGAKRVIYAHEDSIMVTIHEYSGDIEEAEEHLVFKKESDWLEFANKEPMLPLEGGEKCLT